MDSAPATRTGKRRKGLALAGLGLVVAAGVAVGLWRASSQRVERYVAEAGEERGALRAVRVERGAARRLGSARPAEVDCLSYAGEARDGAVLGDGRLLVATAGGLLAYPRVPPPAAGMARAPGGAADSPPVAGAGARDEPIHYTHLDGLPALDLTATARLGERVLVGDRSGGLALVDGERALPLRVGLPRPAPVADLVAADGVAYALYTGLGVLGFALAPGGERAVDVGATARVDLGAASALCLGARGLAVGTREGTLYVERGGGASLELARVPTGLEAPLAAVACPTADLPQYFLGTPLGLYRLAPEGRGGAELVREDLFVTAILPAAAGLMVATFDDGVYVVDPATGQMRGHLLAGRSIQRLRGLDDGDGAGGAVAPERVLAFGPGGTAVLGGTSAQVLAGPPRGLGGAEVTAIARDGAGLVWVGTFDRGIDLVDGALRPVRHLPEPSAAADARDDQVNAFLYQEGARAMLAATVHGVDIYPAAAGMRRLALSEDESDREGVAALALTPAGLALATARGLVLADGARRRLVSAFHGLGSNHVYAVALTHDRRHLAAGTLAGLSLVELGARPRVVRRLDAGPGRLGAAWVTALAAAPEGLYIGTYGGGVQLLRGDGSVDDLGAGRFHVNPGALVVERGTLWVGTLAPGLLACDLAQRRWRRLSALLPPGGATAIFIDQETFYLGGPAGLVRASRRAVEAALVPLGGPLQTEEAL